MSTRLPDTPGAASGADRGWALTFEHSPIGMAVVALDGPWRQVNQGLCQMLGYDADQLMSMTFHDLTHPDDLEQDHDLLQECLAGRRDGYRMVKRYQHADGHVVWGDTSVALVRDEHGPTHFLSQVLDVSEHRADKARLEMVMDDLTVANRDLAQFATVISHDLKTPLATIRASLELLTDALSDDATVESAALSARAGEMLTGPRSLAVRAEAAAERMTALIDALLTYTTTDPRLRGTDGGQVGTRPTRLVDVVEAAVADVAVLIEGSGAEVRLEPELLDTPAVQASPALIRTLLVNLLSNAVKYRDHGRPLCVDVTAAPDPTDVRQVLVTVSNDGPALDAADRERLFALFSRGGPGGSGGAEGEVPGFGIGLAACRRIVSWHGGRIWFADPDPDREGGGGVVVRFTLPRAASTPVDRSR